MKLETSQDLLNRLMAKQGWSWYRMAKELPAHENTVYSWKGGHTIVDRKFAPRIAELLGEPAEYVLAILEAEREQSAEVLKVWKRIAERFRSTASILLVCLGLMTAPETRAAQMLDVGSPDLVKPTVYTLCAIGRRARRRLRKLLRCPDLGLKSHCASPLSGPWAWIRRKRLQGSPSTSWSRSLAYT